MNLKLLLLIAIALVSCKGNRNEFNYETSIASKVYQAQLKYLDKPLCNYARISKTGDSYFQESHYLDRIAKELKDKIEKGEIITDNEQTKFYEHFEKRLLQKA